MNAETEGPAVATSLPSKTPAKKAAKKKGSARLNAAKVPDTAAKPPAKAPALDNGQIQDLAGHTRTILHGEKQVTIRINSTPEPGGKDDVFVGVNGLSFLIQRDKDTPVPFSVYQDLCDAKHTVYTQTKREDGEGMQLVENEVQRFSMSARM